MRTVVFSMVLLGGASAAAPSSRLSSRQYSTNPENCTVPRGNVSSPGLVSQPNRMNQTNPAPGGAVFNGTCPELHVFGARETTAPAGFGTSRKVVDLILAAYPGSTSEAIVYPALGDSQYASSVRAGYMAIVNQTTAFSRRCPSSTMVLVGYSQGGQIMDTAFCGGPDGTSLTTNETAMPVQVGSKVAAMIWMGNPRFVPGLPYNVGTSMQGGFAARPSGFVCKTYSDIIRSYCDAEDPFCSKGNDSAHHQLYGEIYGAEALAFVQEKLTPPQPQTASASAMKMDTFVLLFSGALWFTLLQVLV